MSMISEQVKGLRKLANQWKHNDVAAFNLIFEACDTIEALSAKVRDQNFSADRPTGEWTDNHNGTFTCDQCGCKHSKSNFCPNCGAKMKGADDED